MYIETISQITLVLSQNIKMLLILNNVTVFALSSNICDKEIFIAPNECFYDWHGHIMYYKFVNQQLVKRSCIRLRLLNRILESIVYSSLRSRSQFLFETRVVPYVNAV